MFYKDKLCFVIKEKKGNMILLFSIELEISNQLVTRDKSDHNLIKQMLLN